MNPQAVHIGSKRRQKARMWRTPWRSEQAADQGGSHDFVFPPNHNVVPGSEDGEKW